jgi:hypothetical protein
MITLTMAQTFFIYVVFYEAPIFKQELDRTSFELYVNPGETLVEREQRSRFFEQALTQFQKKV